jgi:hypothetical protein
VLIERSAHGTKVTSSDDVLQLGDEHNEFFAFPNGVSFELTVNGHSIWWGAEKIAIPTIRRLANVRDEDDLVWQRVDEPDQVLALQGDFDLGGRGVEHFKSHKRPDHSHRYHFFVAGVAYTTEHQALSGAQIMAMIPGWDPADSLVLEGDCADPDEVIRPTTTVNFKDRHGPAQFAIVPPATFGAI